jgi:hypothetical protein
MPYKPKAKSITTRLQHDHKDWTTNSDRYCFPEISRGPLTFKAVKNPDQTISVSLSAPEGDYDFKERIPPCDGERGLHVAVTWNGDEREVKLYLNGQLVKARHGPRTKH